MLALRRKKGERVLIGDAVRVTVLRVEKGRVTLGVDAPPEVRVDREEVRRIILAERAGQDDRPPP
jgi:carbon storage regulator